MSSAGPVVRAVIHPSIGVARIGNSATDWFVGPEVADPPPEGAGFYRDATGALKRQAARFRIYGIDGSGAVVGELTPKTAGVTIDWKVHLCNRKGQWYQFQIALDIPEAKTYAPSMLRNISVADRTKLAIDPGYRTISGCNTSGPQFDSGKFLDTPVHLGELRTDPDGRLLVLGGRGVSKSIDGSFLNGMANNDGWYDDTSDGPVTATVRIDGEPIDVTPAWVVVAPPSYSPLLKSVRTMWDLMLDVAINQGWLSAPTTPSFLHDIRPIFHRMSMLQWVNAGYATTFGWGGPFDFASDEWLAKLGSPKPRYAELRRTLYNQFRKLPRDGISPLPWPWLYGDSASVIPVTPNSHLVLGQTQMANLSAWADGNFVSDYPPTGPGVTKVEDLPLDQQGAMLDRAALEFCIADAFAPGLGLTWIMRDSSLYTGPFRIRHAPDGWVEPSYGAALNYPFAVFPGQVPGGLTRWMSVPWQADIAACLSGYNSNFDLYVPTFWPANVPNHVLTESQYAIVMDKTKTPEQRAEAFAQRPDWQSVDYSNFGTSMNERVQGFPNLGLVEPRPGPTDGTFPASIQVADRPNPKSP
jgi:hypothetical protein